MTQTETILAHLQAGGSIRQAEARVRRMRRWKKKAGPGHRQSAAHALKGAVTQALIAAAQRASK
jgi:hypothetical protein